MLLFAAVVAAYVGLAMLGAAFAVLDDLTVWYPPVGLAMAAAALLGRRVYPALALGEILVGLLPFGVGEGLGWLVVPHALAYAAVHTVAGRAMARLGGTAPTVSWRRPMAIIVVGGVAAPVLGAAVGVGFQWVGGLVTAATVPTALLVWALGDAVGGASVGVAIVTVAVRARRGGRWWALPNVSTAWSLVAVLAPAGLIVALGLGFDDVVPFATATLVPYLVVCVVGGVPAAGMAALPLSLATIVVAHASFADDLIGRTDLQVLLLVVIGTGLFVGMVVEERRELGLTLSLSERDLVRAQVQARTGSFRLDVHDGEIAWSAGLRHLLGVEEPRGDASTYLRHVHPEDRDRIRARLRAAARTGDGFDAIHRVHPVGGGELVVRSTVQPRTFDGRVTDIFGTVTDVTAEETSRRRLADALEREQVAAERHRQALALEEAATERVRQADRIKEALLVAVSHEVRTPLAVVRGVSDTLGRPEVRDELGAYAPLVDQLERQTVRLERILSDLLDVDRIGRGVVVPNRHPVDVADLIAGVADHVRIDRSRLAVEVDERIGPFPLDTAITARIVEHLLVNASRHAPDSVIEVHARPADDALALVVADRGPGIDEDLREELFEPFTSGTRDHASPSAGMGLYIVDRFTALQGGYVSVTAREGGGTAVTVVLPREDHPSPAADAAVRG